MNLEINFPLNSTILNSDSYIAKVIGYKEGYLIVEGVGEFASIGKWLASPEQTILLSDNHFGISNNYEYFIRNKDLYRAPISNPIVNGYRQGARFQVPTRLLNAEYLEMLGL